MHYFFLMLVFIPLFAITIATVYTTARQWAARRACYQRASLGSLVRAARKSAILRHYGRV